MAALYGFLGPPDRKVLDRMGAVLSHRGPGEPEVVETPHASFGFRGLPERATPGWGASRRRQGGIARACGPRGEVVAAFAGMPTGGQTPETIARRWAEVGERALDELHGPFVLAVLDRPRLVVARDQIGARSVFFAEHAGRVFFAVEPKGVLASGMPRRLRADAVAQFLTFSFIPLEGTMVEGLREVPAGCFLSADIERAEAPRLHRYFAPECGRGVSEPPPGGEDDAAWIGGTRRVVERAIDDLRPPGEPLAVFLSGGLDSSLVAAALRLRHDAPVHTYSIHFGRRYPNELMFAREVAELAGTEHHEVEIRPKETLPRLRRTIWHLDDAIGDPITMPNYELARRVAADGFRFVFNGEGGDPVFGGPKNIPMLLEHAYGGPPRPADFRERAYLASYRRAHEAMERLLSPDLLRNIDLEGSLGGVLRPFFESPRPPAFLDKLMLINTRLKGAHLILPKVERMLGAQSPLPLTPLSPLFDRRVVELAFRTPPRVKLRAGVEKWVLKRAFEDVLPASVVARPKSGMRVPVSFWFRGELRRYARSVLDPKRLGRTGLYNPKGVAELLRYETGGGQRRHGIRLWMLLTLEICRRIVIEGEAV